MEYKYHTDGTPVLRVLQKLFDFISLGGQEYQTNEIRFKYLHRNPYLVSIKITLGLQ